MTASKIDDSGATMISVEPGDIELKDVQKYLLGGVAPRPIALISTLSTDGIPNLAPYSFFNAFGANPPTVAFSASRRIRDDTTKDTLRNLEKTGECVIQAVTYDMVHQISLTSTDFDSDIDEFVKSGLTPVKSDLVKPFRVAESPYQLECRLSKVVDLGTGPGSGNLAICEVVKFHIHPRILTDGVIDPQLIDLVARMGGAYYSRSHGSAVFEIKKARGAIGIGFDQLPEIIRNSSILTGNHLAQLAEVTEMPKQDDALRRKEKTRAADYDDEVFDRSETDGDFQAMYAMALSCDGDNFERDMMRTAAAAIDAGKVDFAWNCLLLLIQEK